MQAKMKPKKPQLTIGKFADEWSRVARPLFSEGNYGGVQPSRGAAGYARLH